MKVREGSSQSPFSIRLLTLPPGALLLLGLLPEPSGQQTLASAGGLGGARGHHAAFSLLPGGPFVRGAFRLLLEGTNRKGVERAKDGKVEKLDHVSFTPDVRIRGKCVRLKGHFPFDLPLTFLAWLFFFPFFAIFSSVVSSFLLLDCVQSLRLTMTWSRLTYAELTVSSL